MRRLRMMTNYEIAHIAFQAVLCLVILLFSFLLKLQGKPGWATFGFVSAVAIVIWWWLYYFKR